MILRKQKEKAKVKANMTTVVKHQESVSRCETKALAAEVVTASIATSLETPAAHPEQCHHRKRSRKQRQRWQAAKSKKVCRTMPDTKARKVKDRKVKAKVKEKMARASTRVTSSGVPRKVVAKAEEKQEEDSLPAYQER